MRDYPNEETYRMMRASLVALTQMVRELTAMTIRLQSQEFMFYPSIQSCTLIFAVAREKY